MSVQNCKHWKDLLYSPLNRPTLRKMAFVYAPCTHSGLFGHSKACTLSKSHRKIFPRKTKRSLHLPVRISAVSVSASSNPSKSSGGSTGGDNNDEDERLQNDRPYVMREFGKVAFVATLIGLVLFCFDILVSLVAITLGSVYALAVLFDIRFITNRVSRLRGTFADLTSSTFKTFRIKWESFRTRIYDLLSRS